MCQIVENQYPGKKESGYSTVFTGKIKQGITLSYTQQFERLNKYQRAAVFDESRQKTTYSKLKH